MDASKVNETKEKLKKAFDLEMKLYECNQLIDYFDRVIKYEPKKETYSESFNENNYRVRSVADFYEGNDWFEYGNCDISYLSKKATSKTIAGFVFVILGFILGVFYSTVLYSSGVVVALIASTMAGTIFSYIGLVFFRKAFDINYAKKRLNKATTDRFNEYLEIENQKKNDKANLEERVKQKNIELDEQYQNTLVVVNQTKKLALEKKNEKENEKSELLVQLKNHYEIANIAPSYRNLVAVSTMYGYFINNRMYELEGPDGAYNLYEQEMTNKLIILELDSINKNLKGIRENQQQLLGALKETNRLIDDEINTIYRQTENLIASQEMTRYAAAGAAQAINNMRNSLPMYW